MPRKTFADLMSEQAFDVSHEYRMLSRLAYGDDFDEADVGLMGNVDREFYKVPFRGTALTLEDFDEALSADFLGLEDANNLDDLLLFCEYLYSFAAVFPQFGSHVLRQVELIAEKASHKIVKRGDFYILIPVNSAAILAAELAPDNVATDILAYQHRSLQGDIEQKKEIIVKLAGELEPMRDQIKLVNSKLESDLFYLVNNANIRHNNFTLGFKNYNETFAVMEDDELEIWYDRIYELCITAFSLAEYSEWKKEVDQLKQG